MVIVGQSDIWPTPALASKILSLVMSTHEEIGIRGDSGSKVASSVEEMAKRICLQLGRQCVVFTTDKTLGSKAGYLRDNRMVAAASSVFAFLGAEGTAIEGGTQHVVDVALRSGTPVTAYGMTDGGFIELGSDNGYFTVDHYGGYVSWKP